MQKTALRQYRDEYVDITNAIVRAKKKTNLFESKVEVLALFKYGKEAAEKIKLDTNDQEYKVKSVKMSTREIADLLGFTSNKIYTEIQKIAFALKEKIYVIEDSKSHQFTLKSVYGDVIYVNGILEVEFNPEMERYYKALSDGFTHYSLGILFNFKTNGAFQLYKLLRSYIYSLGKPDQIDPELPQEEQDCIEVSYDLAILRMEMGFVDLTKEDIRQEMKKKNPDFRSIDEMEKNPQYKRWANFCMRVLEPGIREINETSDIYVKEVTKNVVGRGAKIQGATFVVQWNKKYFTARTKVAGDGQVVEDTSQDLDEEDFLDIIREKIDAPLKTKELRSIADAAGWDMERITKAASIYNQKKDRIENPVGWLISAIRDGYEKKEATIHLSKEEHAEDDEEVLRERYEELREKKLLRLEMTSEELAELVDLTEIFARMKN